MTEKIYVMAPASTWDSDRYEEFLYKIYHEFPTSIVIEQRDTPTCPSDASLVVFVRSEAKLISLEMWEAMEQLHQQVPVRLARLHARGKLLLVKWRDLTFEAVNGEDIRVGYVLGSPKNKQQEKVKI